MLLTCVLTVVSLTNMRAAISRFDSPWARWIRTSVSRGDSSRSCGGLAAGGLATNSAISRRVTEGARRASPRATVKMPAISGALAALAGVLLAYQNTFAVFSRYDVIGNVYAVALGVIGGIGSVLSALTGGGAAPDGIVAQAFSSLGDVAQWVQLFGGLAVMLTAMFMPDGPRSRRCAHCAA